jgi:hypothetical protein
VVLANDKTQKGLSNADPEVPVGEFRAVDRLLGSYWLFNNSELGNAVWRNQYRKSACVQVSRIELDWLAGMSHGAFMRTQLISCRLPKADSALLRSSLLHHLFRFVYSSSVERGRGIPFAEASDPGGSRNGSTEMRS